MEVCRKQYLRVFLAMFLLNSFFCYGQSKVDTLKGKTFIELFQIINAKKTLEQKNHYTNYLIKKAKKENNDYFLIAGYHTQAIIHNDEVMIKYSDSIIHLTLANEDRIYPCDAYQLKGDYYFNKKEYKLALDNYLKVSFYANKYKDEVRIFDSNYNIAILKRKINEKRPALKLLLKNYFFAKNNPDKILNEDYITSISAVSNIYNDLNKPDSASFFNKLGIIESKKSNDIESFNHFSLNEGVSFFYEKKYNKAIDSLEKYIPYFEKKKSKINLSLGYYYCGKSYLEIGKRDIAINYFKKLDTVFQVIKSIYPISRNGYEHLISYYKDKKDLKNQLVYINQLIKVDSILHSEEIYLNRKIFKEYDIPKLNSEKKAILKKMKETNTNFYLILSVISLALLISIVFLFFENKKRKLYKKRFEEILNKPSKIEMTPTTSSKEINIPKEIVENILDQLNLFEKNQGFLSKKITLNSLSKKIETNTNYLSKIINHNKNTSFSNYINTLRIEHITDKLKTDLKIRKFTIKAIAEESGFNNSESFSKAFHKVQGIKPSYFLRELEKLENNN